MTPITKRDLIKKISDNTGNTQKNVSDIVESFIEEVTNNLAGNKNVVLRNFGIFKIVKTSLKIGRNPNDPKNPIYIPPRAVVKFKPGKKLKESIAKILPELNK